MESEEEKVTKYVRRLAEHFERRKQELGRQRFEKDRRELLLRR